MTAPVDANAMQAALRAALVVRLDTPPEDMDALADTIAAYTTQLLPAGRADAARMWRGGVPWSRLTIRLNSIEHDAAAGLGDDGPLAAMTRLRVLAYDCQWLITRYGPDQ